MTRLSVALPALLSLMVAPACGQTEAQEVTAADMVIIKCHAVHATMRLIKPVLDGTDTTPASEEKAGRIARESADHIKAAFPNSDSHWQAYRVVRTEVFNTVTLGMIEQGVAIFDQYENDIPPCEDDYPS